MFLVWRHISYTWNGLDHPWLGDCGMGQITTRQGRALAGHSWHGQHCIHPERVQMHTWQAPETPPRSAQAAGGPLSWRIFDGTGLVIARFGGYCTAPNCVRAQPWTWGALQFSKRWFQGDLWWLEPQIYGPGHWGAHTEITTRHGPVTSHRTFSISSGNFWVAMVNVTAGDEGWLI